jgi:hypothetical protein
MTMMRTVGLTVRLALPVVLTLAGLETASGGPRLSWWIQNPLEKVKPSDPVPQDPVQLADLRAARNEFEPFQIVLRSEGKDVPDLDVEFSDFRTSQGDQIEKGNITVYFEHFLQLVTPSSEDGGAGPWPDALIPRVDRYAHERRNAFPFDLQEGRTQPLWVDVFVPAHAVSGEYTGSALISSGGKVLATVPLHLTVWSFALPSTSSLKSSFGLSGVAALKQHRGRYTDDAELYSITRLYAKAALEHRISIEGGSMAPPKWRNESRGKSGRVEIDWSAYDAEVGPALDGTLLTGDDPLSGAKATSVDLRTPAEFENNDQRAQYWIAWTRHFEQKGWLDRLFLYLWDEPTKQDFAKVLDLGRSSLKADPRIRNLVTVPFTPDLQEVVNVWVPLVNCLERKPGYDDFCASAPALDAYLSPTGNRTSLWDYQSCASHGCNIVGGPYFKGWPSYMIDTTGAANRVMEWVSWKFGIEGELYYSMNEAYGPTADPWTDVRLFGGNGDGTLFYPGRPSRIGGHTDIPIESIRLKLIREGMEDYEYLVLLERLRGHEAAAQFANRIVTTPYQWESRSTEFLKVRRDLGELLDRLVESDTAAERAVTPAPPRHDRSD